MAYFATVSLYRKLISIDRGALEQNSSAEMTVAAEQIAVGEKKKSCTRWSLILKKSALRNTRFAFLSRSFRNQIFVQLLADFIGEGKTELFKE